MRNNKPQTKAETMDETRLHEEADGYTVRVLYDDYQENYRVEVGLGTKRQTFALSQPCDDLTPQQVSFLKRGGNDPAGYFRCGNQIIRAGARPILDATWAEDQARITEAISTEAKLLTTNVPGLEALRAAVGAEEQYQREFTRMMEDEGNDGANPPIGPNASSTEVAAQYPRAAAYLRAESYSFASHWAKSKAGNEALAIVANGGTIEEAAAKLENWMADNKVEID